MRLHLALFHRIIFLRGLWLLERVLCKSLDDHYDLLYGRDNDLFGIVREHQRGSCQHKASEQGRQQSVDRLLLRIGLVVEPSIGDEVFATLQRVVEALLRSVSHELHVIVAVRAVI